MQPLRAWRQAQGLTQQELADRAGVSLPVVGNIERENNTYPHARTRERIAHALNIRQNDITEFIRDRGDNPAVIYGLVDPRDGTLRYVGQTRRPLQVRLDQHIRDAKRPIADLRVSQWIHDLESANVLPELVIVAETVTSNARGLEREWIAKLLDQGVLLTNCKDAGVVPLSVDRRRQERRQRLLAMSAYPEIAERRLAIKEFRGAHRLTQQGLADLLGVTKSQISRWERGSRTPEPWVILALDSLKHRH